MREIIHSGVTLIDEWLTGVRDGGTHVLTGGPGSGKSSIALQFADAGLQQGESVAMLVNSRADDTKSHARFLGLDLDTPLKSSRLLLLRYRSDFVHTASQAVSPDEVLADLDRIIASHRPKRLIIDSFAPFVSGAPPVGPFAVALAGMLERWSATTLLTFPEELSSGYDRSLEPLLHGASAVIRLVREETAVRRAELLSLRYEPPATTSRRFVIRAGVGIVCEHPARLERLTLRIP
ncbi:MAG TPA: ATPase domain-containing protein [Gemmatimonadaceae bacterium]